VYERKIERETDERQTKRQTYRKRTAEVRK
jgi:hypothetical protein